MSEGPSRPSNLLLLKEQRGEGDTMSYWALLCLGHMLMAYPAQDSSTRSGTHIGCPIATNPGPAVKLTVSGIMVVWGNTGAEAWMGMGGEHGLIEGKADISSCTPAHTDQLNGTQTEAGTQSELRHRTSFWQRSSPSRLPMEEEEEVRESCPKGQAQKHSKHQVLMQKGGCGEGSPESGTVTHWNVAAA